jgi:3-methylcrotonyl-CoA carboxylase alpha subunit
VTRFSDGRGELEALVQDLGGGRTRVVVDGAPLEPDVVSLGAGAFLWRHDGRVERFHCVQERGVIHLAWRHAVYRIEERDEEATSRHRAGPAGLEAPMPGKVIAVRVEVGQRVSKGQEVLVIEAMKMESSLHAPKDGVVGAVHVAVGDAVAPGIVLVELE